MCARCKLPAALRTYILYMSFCGVLFAHSSLIPWKKLSCSLSKYKKFLQGGAEYFLNMSPSPRFLLLSLVLGFSCAFLVCILLLLQLSQEQKL